MANKIKIKTSVVVICVITVFWQVTVMNFMLELVNKENENRFELSLFNKLGVKLLQCSTGTKCEGK